MPLVIHTFSDNSVFLKFFLFNIAQITWSPRINYFKISKYFNLANLIFIIKIYKYIYDRWNYWISGGH